KVSNVPAGVVVDSLAMTFDSTDPFKFALVCEFLASYSERHSLPTVSGKRKPCPLFGLNFQTALSMTLQSGSKAMIVVLVFPRKVTMVSISLAEISVTIEVRVSLG